MQHFSSGYLGPAVSVQSPSYNLTGSWSVTDTNVTNTCNIDPSQLSFPRTDTDVQADGSSSDAITGGLRGNTYGWTLSGNTLTYSGPFVRSACPGSYSMSASVTFDSATHGAGTATWICEYGGVSCTGTQNLTAEKLSAAQG